MWEMIHYISFYYSNPSNSFYNIYIIIFLSSSLLKNILIEGPLIPIQVMAALILSKIITSRKIVLFVNMLHWSFHCLNFFDNLFLISK